MLSLAVGYIFIIYSFLDLRNIGGENNFSNFFYKYLIALKDIYKDASRT